MGVDRRIAVIALSACLPALAAGCGKPAGPAGPATQIEGVRVMRLEGMRVLESYHDRTKAVTIGREGLYRIGARGLIENGGKPIFEATNIHRLEAIQDGARTKFVAVLRDGGGVFFIDPERPGENKRIAQPLKYDQENLRIYTPGNGLWVGAEGGLDFSVDPDGTCHEIRTNDGKFLWPDQIHFYGDDRTAWYTSTEMGARLAISPSTRAASPGNFTR